MIEAIILAGGLGTRLREVVSDVPKPMAPINGKPFLAYQLENLSKNGVNRILLSVGYMSEKIIEFFGNSYLGMEIVYVIEDQPLGTGGALKLAAQSCTQDHVYVFNGDTFVNFNLKALECYWNKNKVSVILGVEVSDASQFGRIIVDAENNKIIGFSEKGFVEAGLVSAGCYLLDVQVLKNFPKVEKFSLERDYFPAAIKNHNFECVIEDANFIDMGTPQSYEQLNNFLKKIK